MLHAQLDWLRCPVSRKELTLQVIEESEKMLDGSMQKVISSGILFGGEGWFYPLIDGIPRLLVEACVDYEDFLRKHLPDYESRMLLLKNNYGSFLKQVIKNNKHTKASFSQEWSLYNYDTDKTWDLDAAGMVQRFLKETDETIESIRNKFLFDAGCGNGKLNILLAEAGMKNVAMDFSLSILRAYSLNTSSKVLFVQGDVQYPPVPFACFDIVHSSGVLIAARNTELSLSCIETALKAGGKISTWSYQPRQDFIHNLFNRVRRISSKMPVRLQYYIYMFTLLPLSFVIKRLKGNKQNLREMMIDILDWFSPQFRWEHTPAEVEVWYRKRNYTQIKITDNNMWGFNMIGIKNNGAG
jgi:ubiquinone/menaquinone biosynthesis C-methylase UbiE/uncharacterized protein YbaR (Trm112 family)